MEESDDKTQFLAFSPIDGSFSLGACGFCSRTGAQKLLSPHRTRTDSLPTLKVIVFITSMALQLLPVYSSLPEKPLAHLPSGAQRWAPCGILEETRQCMKLSLVTLEIVSCGQLLKAVIWRSNIEPLEET